MRKAAGHLALACVMVLCAQQLLPRLALAATCALKTWSAGQGVLASDLNNNFSCINALTQSLADANIASGAAIQYTKLQYPQNYPKAWAQIGTPTALCSSSPCTLTEGNRVSGVTRASTGVYSVTLSYTPPNASFGVWITDESNVDNVYCVPSALQTTAPQFQINCVNLSGTAKDAYLNILIFDADNV